MTSQLLGKMASTLEFYKYNKHIWSIIKIFKTFQFPKIYFPGFLLLRASEECTSSVWYNNDKVTVKDTNNRGAT